MRQNHRYQLARQFDREAAATVAQAREQERAEAKEAHALAEPARLHRDMCLLAAWDALKAGDTFKPGNNEVTIKRKNAWSVTDTNGLSWSITEVTSLSRKRVTELRNLMEQSALDVCKAIVQLERNSNTMDFMTHFRAIAKQAQTVLIAHTAAPVATGGA